MNDNNQKNTDFLNIYNKSNRLATAVFIVSNIIDIDNDLKSKIKNLSLDLISVSVNIKDIYSPNIAKTLNDIEKIVLELVSLLDVALISGHISEMNGEILKKESQFFINDLNTVFEKLENKNSFSVKSVFSKLPSLDLDDNSNKTIALNSFNLSDNNYQPADNNGHKKNGEPRRKDLRKNMILDFIKRHNLVSIKDISSNITGCSEKTIQRELIDLIKNSKIKKIGERRWSKYSVI
ncbi:MAG: hypothetical protein JW740_03095 [Candidatus Zambryskibacteria bacterium]|nr:hypothetical protein [Candidatus Zambryskibacteria bacterium]